MDTKAGRWKMQTPRGPAWFEEARALAIAIFYAIGTAVGGVTGPSLFGYLIGTGSIAAVAAGYAIAAILMLIAAAVEFAFGVDAEQRSLESITEPLSLSYLVIIHHPAPNPDN
jgi:MFS family permease